ncbi:MAG: hypothetical protein JW797_06330 [Bradymonadales bacterium]|nr:hypothetical protein [Bradymonadales bacterium]
MKRYLSCLVVVVLTLGSGVVMAQNWRREPTFGATYLNSGFIPDPAEYPLTAGGGRDPVNVATLGLSDSLTGQYCGQAFITRAPDFRFYFEPSSRFSFLRFYVVTHNGADATLLVNQPDTTWRCNDDSFGTLMPSIDFVNPMPGQYDIWVGTYDASSNNPATFHVTELQQNNPGRVLGVTSTAPPPPPTPQGQQMIAGLNTTTFSGTYAPISVSAGFLPDPVVVSGSGGGTVSVPNIRITPVNGQSCSGWVTPIPSHIMTLSSNFSYIRLDAMAQDGGDTTLILQDPYGNYWCSDDDGGSLNPRIQGALNAGMYRIWVGSYGAGQTHPYNLSVTEYRP